MARKLLEDALLVSRSGELLGEVGAGAKVYDVDEVRKAKSRNMSERAKQEDEQKTGLISTAYESFGGFIWNIHEVAKELFPTIRPIHLVRLMYLSTYMDYENGLLVDDLGQPLSQKTICSLLGVGRRASDKFLSDMIEYGIVLKDKRSLRLSHDCFHKGSISKLEHEALFAQNKKITRIYIDAVRKLYRSATPQSISKLGYIFRIMPYVNINFNVVCRNPLENRLKSIQPLSLGDFAEIVGYGRYNANKLSRTLFEPRFLVNGHEKCAIKLVSGETWGAVGMHMFINPLVYYSGNNHKEVEILGCF